MRDIRATKRGNIPTYVVRAVGTEQAPAVFYLATTGNTAEPTYRLYKADNNGYELPALETRKDALGSPIAASELTPVRVSEVVGTEKYQAMAGLTGFGFEESFNHAPLAHPYRRAVTLKLLDVVYYHFSHRYINRPEEAIRASLYMKRNVAIAAELYEKYGLAVDIKDVATNSQRMKRLKSALRAVRNNEAQTTPEYYEVYAAYNQRSLSDFQLGN